jgi:uncharacterized membrane protein YidH (DUF202 family)
MFLVSKLKIIVKCYLEYRKKVIAWRTKNTKINYMIWFNIKELENKLKIGEVSESAFFNYLLANLIIFSIVPYLSTNDYTIKWVIVIEIIIGVVVTVVGAKMTFDINSAGDKKDYFGRFLSLSFVIGIRLSVFAIIIGTPIAIVFSLLHRNFDIDENLKDFLGLGLFTGFGILYYFILTNSFKKVNQ